MFQNFDLNPKNKTVAFSQCDIRILCENTYVQSAVRVEFVQIICTKEMHSVCEGL